jgi:peptide/nickel transport system substrate-binding protein
MKKVILFTFLLILVISSLLALSCSSSSTQVTSSAQTTTASSITTTNSPTKTESSVTTTAVPATTTIPVTTASNWWDKFGKPQYGGSISVGTAGLSGINFDVFQMVGADNDFWYESLFEPSWTLDRQIWSMTAMYYPDEYWSGNLADSWTVNDPKTITVKLRQGVNWQNKAPVNGREFVASDVQAHYDRLLGTGGGYTKPAPMYAGMVATWDKVTATDKYTVVFKFKQPSALNFQSIADRLALNVFEAPEFAALTAAEGSNADPKQDWHNAVGTGPWILTDFAANSYFTFSQNPSYWGHDPRYPQNQTPYADTLKLLVIPDSATRLAALRSGQMDIINNRSGGLTWQDAAQISKTNPDMQNKKIPTVAPCIAMKTSVKPFTDIRVRQALDMAIDRQAIAKSFYGGSANPNPVGMITAEYPGLAYTYAEWPQSLKDQYTYNPTAAKKLLADAGYSNGFQTNVIIPNDATTIQLMQLFKSYFSDIGVDMTINSVDAATHESMTRSGKFDQMDKQNFAAVMPPSRLIDIYYSKGSNAPFYGLNESPDATYDDIRSQFVAAIDAKAATQIFQQMDKRVIEQHYVVSAPQPYTFIVWQPWLQGYSAEMTMWGQGITYSRLWSTK